MRSHNLVLVTTLLLGVYDLLLLNPLVLLLLAARLLLLHSNQRLHLEIILLRHQKSRLNHRLRFSLLRFKLEPFLIDRTLKDSFNDPVLRHVTKSPIDNITINNPSLLLRVVIGTRTLLAPLHLAFHRLVVRRMVLLLLPTMTHIAVKTNLAPTVVIRHRNVILSLPVVTRLNNKNVTMA